MGLVMDVQRFSLHDGPGIRTTAFLMGCNLRCRWCHNPESWMMTRRMMFYQSRCRNCGRCVALCTHGAHRYDAQGHQMELARCRGCNMLDRCMESCPAEAMVVCGREYTPEELVNLLERDRLFYGAEGGATFSGGEAMLQDAFLQRCLILCRERGLHTCVDTAANVPAERMLRIAALCDLLLIDLKAIDRKRHQRLCGTENKQILENIRLLGKLEKAMWIRIPLVHGENTQDEEICRMADFLSEISSIEKVDLFPVMNHAQNKYRALGLEGEQFNQDVDGNQLTDRAMMILRERSHGKLRINRLS